jgi:hypothetical protein
MRTHLTRLRTALVLLLVGSAVLFLVGSTIERNNRHHESVAAKPAELSGESESETSHEGAKSAEKRVESGSSERSAKILGVDTESLALSIVAVVLSLLLAAAIWLDKWPRLALLAVLSFGLVFAAGDARELVHQADESNGGLAAIAAILIALHLAMAVLALVLLRPRSQRVVAVGEPS